MRVQEGTHCPPMLLSHVLGTSVPSGDPPQEKGAADEGGIRMGGVGAFPGAVLSRTRATMGRLVPTPAL